jgi:hypothetical protein
VPRGKSLLHQTTRAGNKGLPRRRIEHEFEGGKKAQKALVFSRIVRVFHAAEKLFGEAKKYKKREASPRESRSQHVLRTGIPKPPPALPRF